MYNRKSRSHTQTNKEKKQAHDETKSRNKGGSQKRRRRIGFRSFYASQETETSQGKEKEAAKEE